MMKRLGYIIIFLILTGFTNKDNSWKKLDLNVFIIQIPNNWTYIEGKGIDSFIGEFKKGKLKLEFDYCDFGCANKLIPTLDEYLEDYDYEWIPTCPFCEIGPTYTSSNYVGRLKKDMIKELKTGDPDSVDVRPYPEYSQTYRKSQGNDKIKYPDSDYICTLRHDGDSIVIPIEIPERIVNQNITVTRTDRFIIKPITPKNIGDGMTGVYYKCINGKFNFNLYGYNLNKVENDIALEIFKRIEMK